MLTPSLKGTEIIWSRDKKLLSYSAARQEDSENITGYIHPSALSTARGRVVNPSWGALFSETLVECNSFMHMWKCCASLQQSWLPSSLTAAKGGCFSHTEDQTQIQPKPHDCPCSLSGDHDGIASSTACPLQKRKRKTGKSLYLCFSSLGLPEEG